LGPPDPQNREHKAPPQRTPSVSERIANRLRDIQKRSQANLAAVATDVAEIASVATDGTDSATMVSAPPSAVEPQDKGKGKALHDVSPPALDPPLPPAKSVPAPIGVARGASPMPPLPAEPIVLGPLSLPPAAVSDLLRRAAAELPLRPIRWALLGEYADCFSGEEFIKWLLENVDAFEKSWDKAEDAARVLTEEEGLLRRVGEFGNAFESADDAFYQFRPKVGRLVFSGSAQR
jgi:hypothetical protein